MSDEHQGASGAPRSAIRRRLEDIRLWLQKQADECRQSAEQIEGRIRAGRPFNGDENVAAHNRKNQAFFQTKADTISEAQAALRACADALAPAPSTEMEIARYYWPKDSQPSEDPAEWFIAAIHDAVDVGKVMGLQAKPLRADALAPPEPKVIPARLPPIDLRLVKTLVNTMKRIPAPPSWVGYMEQLIAEIEWLRAWVPPPAPELPDADVLDAMSTFYNGCDFTLHFKADGRVLLGYGCYGVHWNLVQGARYRLSRWLGMNGEQKAVHLHPETLRTLKERKPCSRCGGFTFEPLAPPRADALEAPRTDTPERP